MPVSQAGDSLMKRPGSVPVTLRSRTVWRLAACGQSDAGLLGLGGRLLQQIISIHAQDLSQAANGCHVS